MEACVGLGMSLSSADSPHARTSRLRVELLLAVVRAEVVGLAGIASGVLRIDVHAADGSFAARRSAAAAGVASAGIAAGSAARARPREYFAGSPRTSSCTRRRRSSRSWPSCTAVRPAAAACFSSTSMPHTGSVSGSKMPAETALMRLSESSRKLAAADDALAFHQALDDLRRGRRGASRSPRAWPRSSRCRDRRTPSCEGRSRRRHRRAP